MSGSDCERESKSESGSGRAISDNRRDWNRFGSASRVCLSVVPKSACAVQMLLVALSLLMCCSLVCIAMRRAGLPRESMDTPMMRPGILRELGRVGLRVKVSVGWIESENESEGE